MDKVKEKFEENKNKKENHWGGKGWIGNIVCDVKRQTPEEYWKEVRDSLLPEYLPVFDATESRTLKEILKQSSLAKPEYRFHISLYDFEDLKEKDFQSIKTFTDTLYIRACDPGKFVLAIFKKKELEKYSIDFKVSEQSIQDIFTERWDNEYYILSF